MVRLLEQQLLILVPIYHLYNVLAYTHISFATCCSQLYLSRQLLWHDELEEKEKVKAKAKNLPLASNFSLLYNSSSLVSVAYSALGDSTIASTGHDSWQKPQ
jgi:hypothetical protein